MKHRAKKGMKPDQEPLYACCAKGTREWGFMLNVPDMASRSSTKHTQKEALSWYLADRSLLTIYSLSPLFFFDFLFQQEVLYNWVCLLSLLILFGELVQYQLLLFIFNNFLYNPSGGQTEWILLFPPVL